MRPAWGVARALCCALAVGLFVAPLRARAAEPVHEAAAQPAASADLIAHAPGARSASPYAVRPGVSLALSAGALGLAALLEGAVRPALTSSLTCVRDPAGFCSSSRLVALDRAALGHSSHAWEEVSDVGQIFLPAAGALTLGVDAWLLAATTGGHKVHAITSNLLVGLEAVSLATSATTVLKYAVRRPRPRQYSATPKVGVDGDLSFPSGHTTLAAAVAGVTATTLTLSHPQKSVRIGAWLLAGATTATMATSRVLAGKHFPTDVIAGALVGGLFGVVVPLLHRLPVRVVPEFGPHGYVGVSLEGTSWGSTRPRGSV